MGPRVLIRTDASSDIGFGHLQRCLSLADELARRRWQVGFACHQPSPEVASRIVDRGYEVLTLTGPGDGEIDELVSACHDAASRLDWIILDHYGLGSSWLRAARRLARHRLVIDDLARMNLPCEIVVAMDPTADPARYAKLAPRAELLAGLRYALLGKEFAALRDVAATRQFAAVRTIIVAFGGSDPCDLTRPAVRAVAEVLPEARILAVLGPGYQHDPSPLQALSCEILRDPPDLPGLVMAADIGVGAAGGTLWEWWAGGLPSVVIAAVENQAANARFAESSGAGIVVPRDPGTAWPALQAAITDLSHDGPVRRQMSAVGRRLVDGRGAIRVSDRMDGVRVRPAGPADETLLWQWANDPITRANSLDEDQIPLVIHRRWFSQRLDDPATLLLIGENGGGHVGQVRFDLQGRLATISISVAPERRGGIGGLLLRAALSHLAARGDVDEVRAVVKDSNEASRRMFLHAGFVQTAADGRTIELRAPIVGDRRDRDSVSIQS